MQVGNGSTSILPSFVSYLSLEYVNENGTGYLQHSFSAQCSSECGHTITKESLATAKLANDITRRVEDTAEGYLAYDFSPFLIEN
jgi:hypothetical protein